MLFSYAKTLAFVSQSVRGYDFAVEVELINLTNNY